MPLHQKVQEQIYCAMVSINDAFASVGGGFCKASGLTFSVVSAPTLACSAGVSAALCCNQGLLHAIRCGIEHDSTRRYGSAKLEEIQERFTVL